MLLSGTAPMKVNATRGAHVLLSRQDNSRLYIKGRANEIFIALVSHLTQWILLNDWWDGQWTVSEHASQAAAA